jgi:DNA-binding beta-propeller fold protein YncE
LDLRLLLGICSSVLLFATGCGRPGTLPSPGCSQAVATAPELHVRRAMVGLPASPFGVASVGRFSFVTVGGYTGLNELQVFRDDGFRPRFVRRIVLPIQGAAGVTLTPDKRELLVAAGSGTVVVDVDRVERGSDGAVLGSLQAVGVSDRGTLDPSSAIEVVVSPDGNYAFVSLEYAGVIAVFDVQRARATGWRRSGFVGAIPVGLVVVGLAMSPDGHTLYATRAARRVGEVQPQPGTLDVIDVARAERHPRTAVVARVAAGCDPVRVAATPDGNTVWVTARASDALLGFSAARLAQAPSRALERVVRVGEAPVGLALIDGGRRIVVMNSDRFGALGTKASLGVVDGKQGKLLGTIASGAFPREAVVASDGSELLVANWGSRELEVVDLRTLP